MVEINLLSLKCIPITLIDLVILNNLVDSKALDLFPVGQ